MNTAEDVERLLNAPPPPFRHIVELASVAHSHLEKELVRTLHYTRAALNATLDPEIAALVGAKVVHKAPVPAADAPTHNALLAEWREEAEVLIEADDFAKQMLWERCALDATAIEFGPQNAHRVVWSQIMRGTSVLVDAEIGDDEVSVETNVSLSAARILGVLVVFYDPISNIVHHESVRDAMTDLFPHARGRHHNATNFHNAIIDIREILAAKGT